ncbi:MAG: Ppx/GppA phosphatase family protein [Thermomicrobiales bacterium]
MAIVKSSYAVIAAFDVGSNSIKMTVARNANGRIEEFGWDSETVRLGAGLETTGRLADDRLDAALATIVRFADGARAAGATHLVGVATEAVRAAANGPSFLNRVRRETGVEISLISGDQEAALTFRGLAASIDVAGHLLVADVGGGSTEMIAAEHGQIIAARSIPLGSGRLTDLHVAHDPPTSVEIDACAKDAARLLAAVPLPSGPGLRLIVVGGTGEYMMRLMPEGRPTTPADISVTLVRLTSVPSARLATMIQIPEARARVLPAGLAIVQALAARTAPERIEGARSGIRTGLLMAAFAGEM